MATRRNLGTKLDSLYDALEIPRVGNVACLGHRPSGIPCTTDWKLRRNKIEPVLLEIIKNIDNGATAASNEIQKLLMDVAVSLTCTKKHHDHPVTDQHRVYNKEEYVAFLLGVRLKDWDGNKDEGPSESSRSNASSLPPVHLTPGSARLQRRQPSQTRDDTRSSDEGDDERDEEDVVEVSAEEWTISRHQRPELARDRLMMYKSTFLTPTKQRGRTSLDAQASIPRMRQLVDDVESWSFMDDASIASPESVISPGPSDVFSPASTAPTPMSIGDQHDSEFRLHRSRYARGEEGSPTRKPQSSPDDDLLEDAMRRMRLTSEGPSEAPTLKCCAVSKYGDDSSYLKKYEQPEQSLQLDDQDMESEWPTDDNDEIREQPTSKDNKVSLSLKIGNMTFDPAREVRNPLGRLLERLQKPLGRKSLSPGWVYCFAEKTAPGYLKIGYKQYEDDGDDTILLPEEQQNDAKVMKRLREWERDCKHDIDYKFICYMPCAARTMEGLVHRTLHKSNRKAHCPNPACTKGHREWFEISEMEARRAVEVWQQFSRLKPYTEKGRLKDFWHNRTWDDSKSYNHLPVEEWVYERWAEVIVPAAVERKKQISELQKKESQLAERRREAQERKKRLELEIQSLKQEEEEIQRELAELQSQH
ncbi:hypothetical protein FALCPG4_006235 [Fusarium falciforme]